MAILQRSSGDPRWILPAHSLIGRSQACTLQLESALVSGEHARLYWRDASWELRDLGSRNGTFVNDIRLSRGGMSLLALGDKIAFGDPNEWYQLADSSEPVAMARQLDTKEMVVASAGMLVLPCEDAPLMCVLKDSKGRWVAEQDGEVRPARDGEVVAVSELAYMLHLPVQLASTLEVHRSPLRTDPGSTLRLELRVSRNMEKFELTAVILGGERHKVSTRAHLYTLMVLAQERLQDREQGLGSEQRGWRAVEEICRMQGADVTRLNVDIYRIRKDMATLGIADAGNIIERRRGEARVGLDDISLLPMG